MKARWGPIWVRHAFCAICLYYVNKQYVDRLRVVQYLD